MRCIHVHVDYLRCFFQSLRQYLRNKRHGVYKLNVLMIKIMHGLMRSFGCAVKAQMCCGDNFASNFALKRMNTYLEIVTNIPRSLFRRSIPRASSSGRPRTEYTRCGPLLAGTYQQDTQCTQHCLRTIQAGSLLFRQTNNRCGFKIKFTEYNRLQHHSHLLLSSLYNAQNTFA